MAAGLFVQPNRRRLSNRPYRETCGYISADDFLPADEFNKLSIADTHWVDWNNSTRGNRGITTNPSYLLKLFSEVIGDYDRDLRHEMLTHLSVNTDYYGKKIVLGLIMHKIDIIDWVGRMTKDTCPLDEIGLYILSNYLNVHTTVYRRHRLWSTLDLKGATEDSLVANSELLLVWIEPGRFCVLREKKKDNIRPPHFAGHVSFDPATNQMVYTPWNMSEKDVAIAVDGLDPTKIKRELVDPAETVDIEESHVEIGHVINYEELRGLYIDRSPLHSATETSSDDDSISTIPAEDLGPTEGSSDNSQESDNLLKGATEYVERLEQEDLNFTETRGDSGQESDNLILGATDRLGCVDQETALADSLKENVNEAQPDGDNMSGATTDIMERRTSTDYAVGSAETIDVLSSNQDVYDQIPPNSDTAEAIGIADLETLRKELYLTDSDAEPEDNIGIKQLDTRLTGATKSKPKPEVRTLEEAIWKSSKTEFLLVDDSILAMPDCTLSIRNLSTHEIEIEMNPSKGAKEKEQEIDETEGLTEDTQELPRAKIKIGTGSKRRKKSVKMVSDSESDGPRYSMRMRPTPRRISIGGRALRNQKAINYQESYNYRTGRIRAAKKTDYDISAALSEPSDIRQAAQDMIKNPLLRGTTPTTRVPVLVLKHPKQNESDDTVIYDDVTKEGEEDPTVPDPQPQPGTSNDDPTAKPPRVKGTLTMTKYVIRRPKKKITRRFKCSRCSNHYDSIKTLNRHYRKRHRRVRCVECGKLFSTPSVLRHHAYAHSVGVRYECKDCGEKFVFKSYLKVHLIKHSDKATYRCPIVNCLKKFKHKGELVRHRKEHDNVNWVCRRCHYSTDTERKLKQHMNSHLQIKKYKCKYCGEKFVHSMQLVRHYWKCEDNPDNPTH